VSRALRVALVTNYPADPTRVAGGVQAVSARLVAEMRNAPDLELHVVHCHSDIAESRIVTDGSVTVHYLAQTRSRLIPNMMTGVGRIAAELRRIAPDVVNAHGPSFAIASIRAGYRPIWTIHSVLAQEAMLYRGMFNRLSFALARRYERQALAQVETITTVSHYVVEANRERSRSDCVWHVIDNPAPAELFTMSEEPVTGRVLMPASLIPLKDPLTLVQAAAQMQDRVPNLGVHLAGSLADVSYVAEVRREIAKLGLGETVTLLGALDAETLRQEYRQATVVALPSRQEVAPMAVIEAMAAGIPVVVARAGGLPYIVEDGVTGRLTAPGDAGALADVLTEFLTKPDAAARMGAAGRAVARTRFDPARVAAQYLALYRATENRQ
jgi:glycosyltransferase involved in cell wall biosynthesis